MYDSGLSVLTAVPGPLDYLADPVPLITLLMAAAHIHRIRPQYSRNPKDILCGGERQPKKRRADIFPPSDE